MTTRAELRSAVRRRLEDTALTPSPLWDDAVLNDALACAIRDYSARFPVERSLEINVAAGATKISDPALAQSGGRITRVIDARGYVVPRNWDLPGDAAVGEEHGRTQAWCWWDAALRLDRPAIPGIWKVEYLGARTMPNDDVSPVDLPLSEESLIVGMATIYALHRRAVEDGKRGHSPDRILSAAAAIRTETDRALRLRAQRVRSGLLRVS